MMMMMMMVMLTWSLGILAEHVQRVYMSPVNGDSSFANAAEHWLQDRWAAW